MTEAVNSSTAGDQVQPVSASLANGGHVVAWTSGTPPVAMAQLYDAGGARIGGEMTLASGYSVGGIVALADGTFVVNLTQSTSDASGPHSAVSYARFDTAGHAVTAPVLLDGSGNYDTWLSAGAAFATPGGGFALVETSTSRPTPLSTITHTVRYFDASGTAIATVGAGEYWRDEVHGMKNGGFVTATQAQTGPAPTRIGWFAVDGQGQVSASGSLNSVYGQTEYGTPSSVALADGRALVVWTLSAYDNGAWTTKWQGQWIDAAGHASGAVFDWNFQDHAALELTALAGGGFVATFAAASYRGTAPYEFYAQTFDAQASPTSGLDHLASLSSGAYSVAATADGGYIVDYQLAANGQDIFEEKFGGAQAGGTPNGSPMIGTSGIDTISLAGAHTQYTVTQHEVSGPSGTTPISSIERIVFGDGYAVALDVDGHAGEAYRLYKAAFDRAPDLGGLGYQMHDLDLGYSLSQVAANFIASPEFQSKYGVQDESQFVSLLYEHVLHREAQQFEIDYHVDNELHAGYSRADVLTFFSESPENQANVIGVIGDGMLYQPQT